MCWHRYKYIGWVNSYYWLGGVTGGIKVYQLIQAKECEKCGKRKVVSHD